MRKLGIGVLGVGEMGKRHAEESTSPGPPGPFGGHRGRQRCARRQGRCRTRNRTLLQQPRRIPALLHLHQCILLPSQFIHPSHAVLLFRATRDLTLVAPYSTDLSLAIVSSVWLPSP